jgi:hypothetical protein
MVRKNSEAKISGTCGKKGALAGQSGLEVLLDKQVSVTYVMFFGQGFRYGRTPTKRRASLCRSQSSPGEK